MDDTEGAEPDDVIDVLFVALRDGAVIDRAAVFDLAMDWPAPLPGQAEARALAQACAADGAEDQLVLAARAFLAAWHEPGFDLAPERFTRLERALDQVRADMRATGLGGEVRLIRAGREPRYAVVQTWAGDRGWNGMIYSSDAADDLSALVAVAESARQSIMESLDYQFTGAVWPACPAHGLIASPVARCATAVWWCQGGGGHGVAHIGHWGEPGGVWYKAVPD